jgi:hypothetical protein
MRETFLKSGGILSPRAMGVNPKYSRGGKARDYILWKWFALQVKLLEGLGLSEQERIEGGPSKGILRKTLRKWIDISCFVRG